MDRPCRLEERETSWENYFSPLLRPPHCSPVRSSASRSEEQQQHAPAERPARSNRGNERRGPRLRMIRCPTLCPGGPAAGRVDSTEASRKSGQDVFQAPTFCDRTSVAIEHIIVAAFLPNNIERGSIIDGHDRNQLSAVNSEGRRLSAHKSAFPQ